MIEAKALVLVGALWITCGGPEKQYAVGDVFHLQANQPHAERYGPSGVTYLVGRKVEPASIAHRDQTIRRGGRI